MDWLDWDRQDRWTCIFVFHPGWWMTSDVQQAATLPRHHATTSPRRHAARHLWIIGDQSYGDMWIFSPVGESVCVRDERTLLWRVKCSPEAGGRGESWERSKVVGPGGPLTLELCVSAARCLSARFTSGETV